MNITGSAGSINITIQTVNAPTLSTGLLVVATGIPTGTVISSITIGNTLTTITLSQALLSNFNNGIATCYATFDPQQWTEVEASTLSGVNRTEGFYAPTANQPGRDLPLLIDGIAYPGVQVMGLNFNQNTGFDIGNFDINPFDNISYGPEGLPTYDPALLDAIYESSYLDIYLGTRVSDINVDGGAYIDTFSSHAPEELIPGSEFDTLDLRVYTRPGADWTNNGHGFPTNVRNTVFVSDNPVISFANQLTHPAQIIVSNVTTRLVLAAESDYTVNWNTQEITILRNVLDGNEIQVAVYEVGGGNQLYNQTYNGADVGNSLVVPVNYNEIQNFAIFVNGEYLSESNYTYQPQYASVGVTATYSTLTPLLSTTLIVSSTVGIQVGSLIEGLGFTSGQTVTVKVSPTELIISAPPTIVPEGELTFRPNTGSTAIDFNSTYTGDDYLCVCVIGPTTTDNGTINYNWSDPTTQYIVSDGGVEYILTNNLEYTNPDNLIVMVNGVRARTSAGIEYIADGSTGYLLPQRLGFSQETIQDVDVHVYVNDVLQVLNQAFTVEPYEPTDPARGIIFLPSFEPEIGSKIKIFVTTGTQCFVNNTQLTFVPGKGLLPLLGDIISVITWNDTRQQDILTKVYVGPNTTGSVITQPYDSTPYDDNPGGATPSDPNPPGLYDYSASGLVTRNDLYLDRVITDPSRLWVTLNGGRLFYGNDFTVTDDQIVLTNEYQLKATDTVMITMFTNSIVPAAMAFRIFQDMRGQQAVYRITPNTTTTLVQPLLTTDDVIYVNDASVLGIPDFAANIWGVITIDGERIMYRERNTVNNTVSSLLRGTAGTAISEHSTGADVYDMGRGNLLEMQYQDYIVDDTILSDGLTTTYIAENIDLLGDGVTINDDQVEVYVAGTKITYHALGLTPGQMYYISEVGNTDWNALGVLNNITPTVGQSFVAKDPTVNSGQFVIGKEYAIITTGTSNPTNFTLIGASNNLPGTTFIATAVGTGTGTARAVGTGLVNYTVTNSSPATVEFIQEPPADVEVTILVRRGVTWYQQGVGTASDGVALQDTNTLAARFLRGQ